ncbi:hypothetical protein F3K02_06420 [Hydrogenophaga sp. D2P1]|uniref:Uncharacterized protein n=1 Tax=Hydrogenophaga aromaticivorans TaxID=2610898 RepID=A0A7Y8GU42_9BURK|nr:hypothetical protein [Hydrogenophaga aromaticivorans]
MSLVYPRSTKLGCRHEPAPHTAHWPATLGWADSSLKCNTCHRVRSADAKHPIQALSTASA